MTRQRHQADGSTRTRPHVAEYVERSAQECPIGLALKAVGQTWTLLLVREALKGVRRFDEFHSRLGVSRPLLSQRLSMLVEQEILERVPYREPNQRSRFEYRLTPKGHDLLAVIAALHQWGERHLLEDADPSCAIEHRGCGGAVGVRLQCEEGHDLDTLDAALRPPAFAGRR